MFVEHCNKTTTTSMYYL